MNRRQQRLDLDTPLQPFAAVPLRVREVTPGELPAPAAARELWAAVQLGAMPSLSDADSRHAFPAALTALVQRAQTFTSRVVPESPDAMLLELGGSQRLFGGLPALLAALRTAFPRPLQLALAPTPLAAVLLARAGRNCCITSSARLQGRLAPLRLAYLHWPEEELRRLESMGVATLGELLRLPRAGLARRIGPERLHQLDRLTGQRADPRRAIPQREGFTAGADPDHETVDRERLVTALQPALARLEDFLRARQRGILALRVTLQFRRAPAMACILRCVVPEYRAARFAALLVARLEALALPEPVRHLHLVAGRLQRFIAASSELWTAGQHGGSAAAAQSPEFLQTLMARLGEAAVHGLSAVDEHRPEWQWQSCWPGAGAVDTAADGRTASFPASPRPLGLLATPLPLDAVCDAAGRVRQLLHAGHDLQLVSGPERIESGWWDGADVARDYYIARATDGAQWWIFRDCAAPRRWFVHGCFT
jgi:protein ImuB